MIKHVVMYSLLEASEENKEALKNKFLSINV